GRDRRRRRDRAGGQRGGGREASTLDSRHHGDRQRFARLEAGNERRSQGVRGPPADPRRRAAPPGPHPQSESLVMVVSVTPQQSVSPEGRPVDECLYLTGRPTLREFLRYVRTHATTQPGKGTLTDEWHAAHDIVSELAATEAGCADDP